MQVTLDILCLTLPRESESLSLTDASVPSRNSPLLQQQLSNNSHNSMDLSGDLAADQLAHLPDHQQRAVNKLVLELRWLMRDEMAACALDDWPVQEATLHMVAEHITQSLGRSTCLLETVPLHFVYETNKCLGKFLEALADLRVNGYRVQAEGSTFYMVKDTSRPCQQPCQQPCQHNARAESGNCCLELCRQVSPFKVSFL